MMIKNLYKKYKSIIMYLFFGVCTTLVNIIAYYFFAHILKTGVMFSTILSWALAVLFAYLTNRKWVFESQANTKKEILEEIISFFSCRLATGFVDWLCMFIFVEKIGFNDVIIKTLANILVIILNYIASKLIIFKKKKNVNNESDKSKYLIYIGFFIITFLLLMISPLHLWVGKDTGIDSSVYKTIALMMNGGYMPYLHSFGHKGPLLYIINYLGFKISPYRGVWIFEFISVYLTMHYMYKIGRLKCNKFISFFISVFAISMLFLYLEGGNLTEEYAMPFIAVSLYIFLDYIFNNVISKTRLLLCGLSFGAVLMLRPNMIGTWFIFCLYIFIKCIKDKKIKELINFIIWFLIGTSIIVLPIIIWLGINGALKDFYFDYIIFNKEYAAYSNIDPQYSVITTIFSFLNNPVIMLSYLITIYLSKKDKKYIIYLIYMIISIFLISMSGRAYYHYMIIFIPIIALPLSEFFNYCNRLDKGLKTDLITVMSLLFLSVNLMLPNWIDHLKGVNNIYLNRNNNNLSTEVLKVSKIITQTTTSEDKISIYGNYNIIYLISHRLHATKYSYTMPIINVSKKIKRDYFNDLDKERPKIIVVQHNDYDIQNFIYNHNYSLIWDNSNDTAKHHVKIYQLQKSK